MGSDPLCCEGFLPPSTPSLNANDNVNPNKIFEIVTKQVQTRVITKYLIKWKNLLVEYLTWEDESFIQKHQHSLKLFNGRKKYMSVTWKNDSVKMAANTC